MYKIKSLFFAFILFVASISVAQKGSINWSSSGKSYYTAGKTKITEHVLADGSTKVIISEKQLTPSGSNEPIKLSWFAFSNDEQKVLLFTNTKKVWRLNTKGDYWVLDLKTNTLTQIGKSLPASSLMFAKFSPDAKSVAYVSNNNVYTEDLATSQIKKLTSDGTTALINGTFDWAYEEEFACRDGIRWSPDSKSIAYWQIDASKTRKYYMINYTDSVYSKPIPVEYPKVGETPSACKIAVVNVADAKTTWMNIPGDPSQHYIIRMEFIPGSNKILTQQLNRKQNQSKLYVSDASTGMAKVAQEESDAAWVEIFQDGNAYAIDYTNGFTFLNEGKSILWVSEKDGWRHLYNVSLEGKPEVLLTKGNYDIIDIGCVAAKSGWLYFSASPDNATQKYLYRCKLDGTPAKLELVSAENQKGTHDYNISPNGEYAMHNFSSHTVPPLNEVITLADKKAINEKESIAIKLEKNQEKNNTEFFKVKTKDGVEMDGWMVKPKNFDPKKKYPVVFYVYTEPAGATVTDVYGISQNFMYGGDMEEDGYIYMSLDNRGTPAPKGRAWRKEIYRKIGQVNIKDQGQAAAEIIKWPFVDAERIAVWGWSGGGAATLNLLFQYPDIFKTGIAVAAISNQLTYDNIYQERFMGLPQENMEDFVKGSPLTYAKNLKGNLLYIHGTQDDNVHYQNAEMLINELVKYNKQFQFMAYPNRTHSISEGEGTFQHLSTLYTNYLRANCPGGGK